MVCSLMRIVKAEYNEVWLTAPYSLFTMPHQTILVVFQDSQLRNRIFPKTLVFKTFRKLVNFIFELIQL